MWMSLHTLQEIHKINDDITGTRQDNLFKFVTVKKRDIKQPQPSSHNSRVPESRLQQTEDHIWRICTSLHRHYQKYKTENGRGDCTNTRKLTGRILFYVPIHQETSPGFHIDRTAHQ